MSLPRSIVWKLCFLFVGVQLLVAAGFLVAMRRVRDEAARGRMPSFLADRAELAAWRVRARLAEDPSPAGLAASLAPGAGQEGFGPALALMEGSGTAVAVGPGFPARLVPLPPAWLASLRAAPVAEAVELPEVSGVALVRVREAPPLVLVAAMPGRRSPGPFSPPRLPPPLVMPALLVAAGLLGGILGVHLITRRVRDAEAGLDRLASGDLTVRLDPGPEDEFGKLLRAVNAMAEELSRQDQARKNLMADISHELRTPLTSLTCQLELLDERMADAPEGFRRALSIAREDGATLGARIGDLLELARGQVSPPSLARERVNLQRLLARTAERFEELCRPAGIRIETAFVPEILELELDPRRITQVFENLLDNARKALEDGGTIRIRVRPGPAAVEVDVEDDGPGIPESQADLIFERFQRGRGAQGPGTGLGLAIVRRFVELHGGTCTAMPVPGGGARFRVTLPHPPAGSGDAPAGP